MSNFPTLSLKPDSEKYSVTAEDPAIKNEMEGGYVTSRPRFTRKPRRTFTIGYTMMKEADRTLLNDFWDEVMGSSMTFDWVNEFTGETISVRFGERWTETYVGKGSYRAWNITNLTFVED